MARPATVPRIYDSRRLSWPVEWTDFFARSGPLLLEIGFGNGQFLVDLADARPEANVVGLEISQPALMRAARRIGDRNLRNVRLVYGPAQQFLWSNCAPGALAEVYVNFPDPWPKAAHQHRRLLDARFLELLATRLVVGGRLQVATDHDEYAETITNLLLGSWYFESRREEPVVTAAVQRVRTKYELKALAERRRSHYYDWQRNAVPAAKPFPVPQELTMPHAIVYSPLALEEIAGQYREMSWSGEAAILRFGALFRADAHELLLIDTFVEEQPVAQRVALTIRPRRPAGASEASGEFVIGVHELGFPRPTAGLQAAVTYLARWLVALHPQAHLLASSPQSGRPS